MLHHNFDLLSPEIAEDVSVERTFFDVNGSRVVLFHKDGQSLEQELTTDYIQMMRDLDLGPVCEVDSEGWLWCDADPVNFNCHTLAIGSAIGLTPDFWLEGIASGATLNTNPVGTLLNECYQSVSGELQDNDVFVFRNSETDHYVHSGFVRYIDDQLMAISKFGETKILITTLELLATVFQNDFDDLGWYRVSCGLEHTDFKTGGFTNTKS